MEGKPLRRGGGQPGRRARHRPVHAGHRQAPRPRGRLQPGRGALRLGALPVRAHPRLRQHRLAAAYNGGEARIARFIAAKDRLPPETRAYVNAITGYSAEIWRDAPPDAVDLSLDKAAAFQAACIAYAAQSGGREFRSVPPVLPWGVVLASNRAHDGLERQVARLQNRHAAILRGEPVSYPHGRGRGIARSLQFAQIGRGTRAEAEALCARLQSDGGDCMVLRN